MRLHSWTPQIILGSSSKPQQNLLGSRSPHNTLLTPPRYQNCLFQGLATLLPKQVLHLDGTQDLGTFFHISVVIHVTLVIVLGARSALHFLSIFMLATETVASCDVGGRAKKLRTVVLQTVGHNAPVGWKLILGGS